MIARSGVIVESGIIVNHNIIYILTGQLLDSIFHDAYRYVVSNFFVIINSTLHVKIILAVVIL